MILLHRLTAVNFKQFEQIDLSFPEKGSILIEGSNEAGKSSLFEAVFFALYGDALGGLDKPDLIRYGADSCEVTLEFSVDSRRFKVFRRQGGRQTAWLEIPQADGSTEKVTGINAVTKAVSDELGMSGAALLNTCFVEQKRLEKLESLKPKEREETINEMVSLKAFTILEEGLGKKSDDEKRVREAKQRYEIADLDASYGRLVDVAEQSERVYAAVRLLDIDARRAAARQRQESLTDRQTALTNVLSLKQRQGEAETLRRGTLALWLNAEKDVATKTGAVNESERAEKDLPELRASADLGARLQQRLTTLLRIEEEDARYDSWKARNEAAQTAVSKLKTALDQAQTAQRHAEAALSAAGKRDALTAWANASDERQVASAPAPDPEIALLVESLTRAGEERDRLQAESEQAEATARNAEAEAERRATGAKSETNRLWSETENGVDSRKDPSAPLIGSVPPSVPSPAAGFAAGLLGAALGIPGLIARQPLLLGVAVLLLLVAAGLVIRWRQSVRLAEDAKRERADRENARADEVRRRTASVRARIEELNEAVEAARTDARLRREMATSAAKAVQEAQAKYSEIEANLRVRRTQRDNTAHLVLLERKVRDAAQAVLDAGISALPDTSDKARAEASRCDTRLAEFEFSPGTAAGALRSALQAARKKAEEAQSGYTAALKAVTKYEPAFTPTDAQRADGVTARADLRAADLPVEPDPLAGAVRERERARERADELARALPKRREALRVSTEQLGEAKAEFIREFAKLTPGLTPLGEVAGEDDASEGARLLAGVSEGIVAALGAADPAIAGLPETALQDEIRRATQELARLGKGLEDLTAEEREPRQALSFPPADDVPLATLVGPLRERHPEAASVGGELDTWRQRRDEAREAVTANRNRRATLAESYGLGEEAVDLTGATEELERAEGVRDANNMAREILRRTRTTILNRVMPATEMAVKKVLPLLTEGRYRDIRWIAEDNRIEVLDARKGDYVAKKVFSGGARDQISLALRLAFALATLPGGKATRPGWLFLDEPLSAFDDVRTKSLVELLTRGLLRQKFPQVFLISHSKAVDPDRFDYRVEMATGRVNTSTLRY